MKNIILGILTVFMLSSCIPSTTEVKNPPIQKVIIEVKSNDSNSTIEVIEEKKEEIIHKAMEVFDPNIKLSSLTRLTNDEAIISIYSVLYTKDVKDLRNDFIYLRDMTDIRNVNMFISSGGGDAFAGLGLADEIERAKTEGFHITAYASGIVASAAVPVFVVCDRRLAASGTIFLVHETAMWKWPGRETASDIRAQNEMMDLLSQRYRSYLAKYSNISLEEWCSLETKTTWFNAEKALEWGLVDEIK